MTILKTSLWFFAGTSDKLYIATLTGSQHGVYTLTAQWGRRGKTLQSQTKGIYYSEWEARREFHKLVGSKARKGYQVTDEVVA